MRIKTLGAFIAVAIGGVLVGALSRGPIGGDSDGAHSHSGSGEADFYTCSMHPQIRLQDPDAKCPLCGMALIPVTDSARDSGVASELVLSPRARKLAEVQTAVVERKFVDAELRLVGKVEYDETKRSYISARIPGRLDRLFVDYTGLRVNEGDHLVYLYSPELLSAQEELLQAVATARELKGSSSDYIKKQAQRSVESGKDKLRLWGLSEEQINEVLERGKPSDHMTINSPISGVVVHKNAVEGMYVETGTEIYTVADLSTVWVKLDAYESDLPWIHYGQTVEFRTEAYPGELFTGQIAFIDPILNSKTRTVKIRVNVPNPEGKLKPEMFVRAVVHSRVAQGGKVMDAEVAGKWISPMHPEIIKDAPGQCDICGMDLVSAESLGYVSAKSDEAPLVIPASAPLITGKRAVVYVEKEPGRYEGREIELGPRAGDAYLVESGLTEGERVVVQGNFKIDSAIQIMGRPSMMNPAPEGAADSEAPNAHEGHDHGVEILSPLETPPELAQGISRISDAYLKLQYELSHDQFEQAKTASATLRDVLSELDVPPMEGEAKEVWARESEALKTAANEIAEASAVSSARAAFESVSNALIEVARRFEINSESPLRIYHCPMAFDGRGADWIQKTEGVENPYYGSAMFSCGSLKETIGAQGDE